MAVDSQVFTLDEFYTYVDWPFALPVFQREYIWDDSVKKLLDDIQKYLQTPKLDQHFIGSIVLQNRDKKVKISPLDIKEALAKKTEKSQNDAFKKLIEKYPGSIKTKGLKLAKSREVLGKQFENSYLIDGQQRTTTISIIAKVLYEHLSNLESKRADLTKGLHRCFSFTPKRAWRVQLNGEDDDDLRYILESHSSAEPIAEWKSGTHKENGWVYRLGKRKAPPICKAYRTIVDWFENNKPETSQLGFYENFASQLLYDTVLIWIQVTDDLQAHLVFDTINASGERLSDGEKVKGLLHYHSVVVGHNGMASDWKDITKNLAPRMSSSSDEITNFLRKFCHSRGIGGKKISAKEVYESIANHIEKMTLKPFKDLIRDLKESSSHYALLVSPPGVKQWKKFSKKDDLLDYNSLGYKQHEALMLSMMHKLPEKEWDSVIGIVSCIVARYLIPLSESPAKLEKPMYEMARGVYDSGSSYISEMKEEAAKFFTTHYEIGEKGSISKSDWQKLDKEWREKMIDVELKNSQAKFLLRKISGIIGNPFGGYDATGLQAEHIFPKGAISGGKWFTSVKDQFPEDKIDEARGRLGNFLILESVVNNQVKRKTWKEDYPRQNKTDFKPNKETWSKEGKKLGKFHGYLAVPWDMAGGEKLWKPGDAKNPKPDFMGSQLQEVNNFVEKYQKDEHWTNKSVIERTKRLLKKAMENEMFRI